MIQSAAATDGVPCETVIGSLREPSDFAGLPVVTDDGVRLEPPAWAKPAGCLVAPALQNVWRQHGCDRTHDSHDQVEQSIDWRAEQPRRGRPPKWLVEQRLNHASEVA